MPKQKTSLTQKQRRIISGVSIALFLALSLFICIAVGGPMLRFLQQPQQFRAWVAQYGAWGRLAFVGMMLLQVVVAIIPGEPLEIGAGYAFGAIEGTLLCMAGILIGSAIIFWLVRRFGTRAVEAFFPLEKIQNHKLLQNPKRLNLLVFIAFFIPGTPKDLLSYLIGLTRMKLSTWLLITGIARIPSVVTSTIGGDALGIGDYTFAIIVFAATLAIALAGMVVYNRVYTGRRANASELPPEESREENRKVG